MGVIATKWLEWITRKDQKAGRTFTGTKCELCKDASWHIARKKMS